MQSRQPEIIPSSRLFSESVRPGGSPQLKSCKSLSLGGSSDISSKLTRRPLRCGVQHMMPTFAAPVGKGHSRSSGHWWPSVEYCRRSASPRRVRRSQNAAGLPGKMPVAQSEVPSVSTLPMAGAPSLYSIPALSQCRASCINIIPAWSYRVLKSARTRT